MGKASVKRPGDIGAIPLQPTTRASSNGKASVFQTDNERSILSARSNLFLKKG